MSAYDSSAIFEFYNTEQMKIFSFVVFRQQFSRFDSVYGFFLLPITIDTVNCFVAIMVETVISQGDYFNKKVVTNYCLKYSKEDLKDLRQIDNAFEVVNSQITEDQSIVFQIARRVR